MSVVRSTRVRLGALTDSQPFAIQLGSHRAHSKGPGSINICPMKVSRPAGGKGSQWGIGQRHEEQEEGKDEREESHHRHPPEDSQGQTPGKRKASAPTHPSLATTHSPEHTHNTLTHTHNSYAKLLEELPS